MSSFSSDSVGSRIAKALALALGTFVICFSAESFSGEPAATRTPPVAAGATQPQPGGAQMPAGQPKRRPDQEIVFKKTPRTDLKLYLYLPADWKPADQRPCIVFWYGGGFAMGTPSQFYRMAEYFAGRGLACACPEYRVKSRDGTGVDTCVEDARSAIRWVKTHHGEWGIDAERVIASGGSAGGTLSLLLVLGEGPDAPGEDPKVSPRPCALVLFNPAQGQPVTDLINRLGGDRDAGLKAVAALNEPPKGMPPAIFFFGTADDLIRSSEKFCEESVALGNQCQMWTAAGKSHGFFNYQPWYDAVTRKADEFLVSFGYLKGEPQIAADPAAVLKRVLPR